MNPATRSLLMRSNRLLGAQLVEHNLVRIEDLETANEKLLEALGGEEPRRKSLLGILAFEQNAVKEENVLAHVAETQGVGLLDLAHYEFNDELKPSIDIDLAWATWSIPFDREEDVTFIATAYYLSPAVRKYWEDHYNGKVLWYGTTIEAIAEFLENLHKERAANPAAAIAAVIAASAAPAAPANP